MSSLVFSFLAALVYLSPLSPAASGQTLPTTTESGQTLPTTTEPGQTLPSTTMNGQTLPATTVSGPTLPSTTLSAQTPLPASDCVQEAAASLLWKPPPSGSLFATVVNPCKGANMRFQAGSVGRSCVNNEWSGLDYSECLLDDSENAFLLLWIPLSVQNVSEVMEALPLLMSNLRELLSLRPADSLVLERTIEVLSPVYYVSATFVLTFNTSKPNDMVVSSLSELVPAVFEVEALGGIPVEQTAPSGAQGFYQSDSCYCRQPDQLFIGLCEQVVPVPACDCDEPNGPCECFAPYFIGDGIKCTIDEDGDGFPNVPLDLCADMNVTNTSYCTADNCPEHYNPMQDIVKCEIPRGFDGCIQEEDEVWEVHWGNTLKGATDRQRCPQGPGFTTRFCGPNGWEPAVASGCGSYRFSSVFNEAEGHFGGDDDIDTLLTNTADVFEVIRSLTTPGGTVSLLPTDLGATNSIIDLALELLEEIQEGELGTNIPNLNVADIFSNVLQATNLNGWISLQQVGAGSQMLLDNAERYALYLSRDIDDDDVGIRTWQRDNIVIGFNRADPDEKEHTFPESEESVSSTFSTIPAQITIPESFLRERMSAGSRTVPVSSIIYRNMEQALPTKNETIRVASMVLSTQVSGRGANSSVLMNDPVVMSFTFDAVENASEYMCAFWQFSNPVGSGRWEKGGVQMMKKKISADGSKVTIYCNATHLTSFAVLVDVSGTLNPGDNTTGVSAEELQALQIVSYIGCAISLVCLLITIVFFTVMGRELFQKVHYFIHLNLAITLFLAYLMFVVGVEPARASAEACVFVAVWLHYFFLSAFSWMLCEGIMLYLMLVLVFSKLSKKWWFFVLIGYGLPVIPVVVTVGARTSDYGVTNSNGTLQYCWLSTSNGVIWAFVGPMLAIILVNVVFMVVALVTVYRSTHGSVKRRRTGIGKTPAAGSEDSRELFKKLFIATLVLLPILGITWVLGVFTVNANTTAFAWLFTIFNSLQGLFIFFFHVLRSDKVWKSRRATTLRSTISSRVTMKSVSSNKSYALDRSTTAMSILPSKDSTNGKFTSSIQKSAFEMDEFSSTAPLENENDNRDCEGQLMSSSDSNKATMENGINGTVVSNRSPVHDLL